MKAVFIAFNQAHEEDVALTMKQLNIKGYTGWQSLIGAGSSKGEPHLGSHAWPTLNGAYLTIVEDKTVGELLSRLKAIDEENPQLGLRSFTWNIEGMI